METKNALQALIENKGWRPIEEFNDIHGKMLFIKFPRMMNLIVRGWYRKVHNQWFSDRGKEGNTLEGITNPEWLHPGDLYMETDTPERMAKIIGVMMEALKQYAQIDDELIKFQQGFAYTGERNQDSIGYKALQQCQKIAEEV